ncbi:MAG: EAL domain-containing protein, partial [Ruthenibacterium sp.]
MFDCTNEQWMMDKYNAISQDKRSGYAFVTFKIKRFRVINRIYGRAVGDELLKMVLDVVTAQLRENECIALLKVNYFNLLLRFSSENDLMQRLFGLIRAVRYMQDSRFHDRVFLGLGVYQLTAEPVDFFVAQYNADLCRTMSKDARTRNPHMELYGVTYQDPDEFFLDPQSKLQQAIDENKIQLYLQPKINLKNGAVAGAEALVRWIEPDGEIIPVQHFLPGLNECGMVRVMDLYLFDVACHAIDHWYHQYGKKIQISVNLSGTCFNYADFFIEYSEIFEKYDFPKECIQFELLESIILNNVS